MRFGSVDTFLEFGDWNYRMGRPVANEGFLKALLTYGTFDTYEFFCPDVHHMEKFSEKVSNLLGDSSLLARVKPSLQIALTESIKSQQYNIFHLGDFTYFMPYLVQIRNKYAASPFPITGVTHSLDAVHMNLRYLELLLSGLAPFDAVICTSQSAKHSVKKGFHHAYEKLCMNSFIKDSPQVRLEQIPLGIDDDLFEDHNKTVARSFLHIPHDAVVALSVGRLSLRQKADWSPVLEMLSRLYSNKCIPKLVILIAGGAEPSDIHLLEAVIARLGLTRRVMLFPNFPAEIKMKLYQSADFYFSLIDNFQETFGLNIVEAMASGLPVIASDFSGYRDLVTHGETGFLIFTICSQNLPEFFQENLGILDPSLTKLYLSQMVALDLDQLQETFINLYRNDDLRIKMGISARTFSTKFHWKKIIQSYEALWKDLEKEAKEKKFQLNSEGIDLLVGNPWTKLAHYSSKRLQDHYVLSLTSVGQQRLEIGNGMIKYDDVAVSHFSELEKLILETLQKGSLSVGNVKIKMVDCLKVTDGQTEYHLLWLLKHGAIRYDTIPKE